MYNGGTHRYELSVIFDSRFCSCYLRSISGNFDSVVTCGYIKYLTCGFAKFRGFSKLILTFVVSAEPLTGSSLDYTDVCDSIR